MRFIIIYLQGAVDARAGEPDHVVLAVIDLSGDVPNRDVLGAEVVIDKHFASNLKRKIISSGKIILG